MHTIYVESDSVESLDFKDPEGNPLISLKTIKPGAETVPTASIYVSTSEEMQVVGYLVNQKYGDAVKVKVASDEHNGMALNEAILVGNYMKGDRLEGGRILFQAIDEWQNEGKRTVSLCFFNPVPLTYGDGMEHLIHTSILSVINAIRTAGFEVEYTLAAPLNVAGVLDKVREHFGEDVTIKPLPLSVEDLKGYDGVWDLTSISAIDNTSEIVLNHLGVPVKTTKDNDSQEKNNVESDAKSENTVPENTDAKPVGIWIKIWRGILRLFGIRV